MILLTLVCTQTDSLNCSVGISFFLAIAYLKMILSCNHALLLQDTSLTGFMTLIRFHNSRWALSERHI